MRNTNWLNFRERKVCLGRKTYMSTMYWYAGPPNSELTGTSNAQKEVLRDLLREMTKISPPESYRAYATMKPTYTIVETTEGKCNYRIDNQMRLIKSAPDARLNIHYQIGRNSHAMVLVGMRPIECPPDITVGLIDEDEIFGFSPGTVMGFIEAALKHSADNKCYTFIEWTIVEVERDRSRSRSGSRIRSRDRASNGLKELGVTAVAAAKVGAKVTATQGSKAALKKVPLVGLGCAAVFGIGRLITGDPLGALGEVTSRAASCFPGVGTAASIGIDVALFARDLKK